MVAYARALQHWAEQNNLPAGVEPCLLVKSILELREEVKWYLSLTDEEVFWGMALHKKEEEDSPQTLCATDISKAHCTPEPAPEGRAPKFLGCERVLHPSQPVVAAREIPQPARTPRLKVGSSQLQNDTDKTANLPSKDPYSTSSLPVDTSRGACAATNPATWLLWSDGLFVYSRTCGGGPRNTHR